MPSLPKKLIDTAADLARKAADVAGRLRRDEDDTAVPPPEGSPSPDAVGAPKPGAPAAPKSATARKPKAKGTRRSPSRPGEARPPRRAPR